MKTPRSDAAFAHELAALRFKHVLLSLWVDEWKAGFDPNQPRVPAGFPNGGQWTAVGGALPLDPIDLLEEERAGGHTYAQHIGKSDAFLKRRVREKQRIARRLSRVPRVGSVVRAAVASKIFTASTFTSQRSAEALVAAALASDQPLLDDVASGQEKGKMVFRHRKAAKTGRVAVARGLSRPKIRNAYGVVVVVRHDPNAPAGFRVLTAYVEE